MALNHTDYLVTALEELEAHAKSKLREVRELYSMARKAYRKGRGGDSERLWEKANEIEIEAKQDLEQIQRILADLRINR